MDVAEIAAQKWYALKLQTNLSRTFRNNRIEKRHMLEEFLSQRLFSER